MLQTNSIYYRRWCWTSRKLARIILTTTRWTSSTVWRITSKARLLTSTTYANANTATKKTIQFSNTAWKLVSILRRQSNRIKTGLIVFVWNHDMISSSIVPRILVIQMKRFDQFERKLANNVQFPFTFSFDKNYLNGELADKEINGYQHDHSLGHIPSFITQNPLLPRLVDG